MYPDLFASERESDPVSYQTKYQMNTGKKDSPSKHQLNIILPNNRAWVSNSNFENDVPSNKVFDTWLAEFDNQIPQDVGVSNQSSLFQEKWGEQHSLRR